MGRIRFTASVSRIPVQDKEYALQHIGQIWRTMQAQEITLSRLKDAINNKYPFLCCKRKNEWDGQQLFCLDIDRAPGIPFSKLISLLDYFGIPPCMAYTTFGNPGKKAERFRLLFLLSAPASRIGQAKEILHTLYHFINELCPGIVDKKCLQPYHLFYPGQKIVLYRPAKMIRAEHLNDIIQSLKKPCVYIDVPKVLDKMRQVLLRTPYIPGVIISGDIQPAPPEYLITQVLHEEPKVFKKTIYPIGDRYPINLYNTHSLCYTLIARKRIIDNIYNIRGALEYSNSQNGRPVMTVFEHDSNLLSALLLNCSHVTGCNKNNISAWFSGQKNIVFPLCGIHILPNKKMVMPSRLAMYANAVMDLSQYPNLQKLFQRDIRKQQVLASVILVARDSYLEYEKLAIPHKSRQCLIPAASIINKLQKRFKQTIDRKAVNRWIKQFHDLHLIHVCENNEITSHIKKTWKNPARRATVIQVPYFTKSVLQYADILAADYKPEIKQAADEKYLTCRAMVNVLISNYGYFTRSSFLDHCIKGDVFSKENAATYFDKYIGQIQQKLDLEKHPVTKALQQYFNGNIKPGPGRIYYKRGTYNANISVNP